MKWLNDYGKQLRDDKLYKNNEERAVKKFAWFPHSVIGGYTVWLSFYYINQRYSDRDMMWHNITSTLHDGTY
jgi:hypothetical protein